MDQTLEGCVNNLSELTGVDQYYCICNLLKTLLKRCKKKLKNNENTNSINFTLNITLNYVNQSPPNIINSGEDMCVNDSSDDDSDDDDNITIEMQILLKELEIDSKMNDDNANISGQ